LRAIIPDNELMDEDSRLFLSYKCRNIKIQEIRPIFRVRYQF
jgi:hypothetical protein